MEKQFTSADSRKYWNTIINTWWLLGILITAMPIIIVIVRGFFFSPELNQSKAIIILSGLIMFAVFVFGLFVPKLIAKKMANSNRWYLKYLQIERKHHSQILDDIKYLNRSNEEIGLISNMLVETKNVRRAKLIREYEEKVKVIKEGGSLKDLERETDYFLDQINQLEKNPEDEKYKQEWSERADNAVKRSLVYQTRASEVMKCITRIDNLILKISQQKTKRLP